MKVNFAFLGGGNGILVASLLDALPLFGFLFFLFLYDIGFVVRARVLPPENRCIKEGAFFFPMHSSEALPQA